MSVYMLIVIQYTYNMVNIIAWMFHIHFLLYMGRDVNYRICLAIGTMILVKFRYIYVYNETKQFKFIIIHLVINILFHIKKKIIIKE